MDAPKCPRCGGETLTATDPHRWTGDVFMVLVCASCGRSLEVVKPKKEPTISDLGDLTIGEL
jgi:rRNA maturation protein Nop10